MLPSERKPCTIVNLLRFVLAHTPAGDHNTRTCIKRLLVDYNWNHICLGKSNPMRKLKNQYAIDGAAILDGLNYMQAYLDRRIEICGSSDCSDYIWRPHVRIWDRKHHLTMHNLRYQYDWPNFEPYFLPLSVAKVDTMLISRSCKWRLRKQGVPQSILEVSPEDRQYDSMRGILYVGQYSLFPIREDYVGDESIIVRLY